MVSSSRQKKDSRSSNGAGKPGLLWRIPPGPALDISVVVVALLAAAIIGLLFLEPALAWAESTLYIGWAPVGLFVLAALVALRYRPRLLLLRWRWWAATAAAMAVLLGIMSFIYVGESYLLGTSLAGGWGVQVVGDPLALGILKVAAVALLTPLLLYPRTVGPRVLTAARIGGRWLYLGTIYFLMALAYPVYLLAPHVQRWINGQRRSEAQPVPTGDVSIPRQPAEPTDESSEPEPRMPLAPAMKSAWQLPSMDLLSEPEPKEASETPLREMAQSIEETLAEHGVSVEVKDIKAGPRIVRFGLVPGWVPRKGGDPGKNANGAPASMERSRVKVQSILTREKDLALALSTPYLRIEAPVPGEALVGLEVPTPTPAKVCLRGVMDNPSFAKVAAKGGLPVALGEDTGGYPVVTDLATLPHLLIAGATGSGKSVCINSLVASLLFSKPPDQMRMLMVDPKRVELTPFNGIPHLVAPVIVDAEEVNGALKGLMREMFRRYRQMEDIGVRNIAGFNSKVGEKEKMPFLVLIVDELADLMMVAGFEVEQNLVRLAQLGRATGIHLVLATQRPSVNVVTGLLKANIAARVAFAVASQVDSRVILDAVGAEKLLGRGDMLLLNSDSPKPRRVQGNLVTDDEIERLVDFWLEQKGPPLPEISLDDTDEDGEEPEDFVDDGLVDQARELALRNPNLSSSVLERRLKVGGSRATQIIDVLVDEGLVIAR